MDQQLGEELFFAIQEGDENGVQACLKNGADPSFCKHEEGTWGANDSISAIHQALRLKDDEKRIKITSLLIENKANLDCKESHYDWRGCGSSVSALELVMKTAERDVTLLRLFLHNKADPNQVSIQDIHSMRTDGSIKKNLLTSAASNQNLNIIKCLLEAGADPNLECSETINNEYGFRQNKTETALHICASTKANEEITNSIVSVLLEHKADVNSKRKYLEAISIPKPDYAVNVENPRDENYHSGQKHVLVEETVVHTAIMHGNSLMVKNLVDRGADLTISRMVGDEEVSVLDLIEKLYSDDEEQLHKMNFAVGNSSLAKSARK